MASGAVACGNHFTFFDSSGCGQHPWNVILAIHTATVFLGGELTDIGVPGGHQDFLCDRQEVSRNLVHFGKFPKSSLRLIAFHFFHSSGSDG